MSTLLRKHKFDFVFDSQRVFRLILEAMSNPARIVDIGKYADKLHGDTPALLAAALTLLDNEVSFNTCGNAGLADEIESLTLAANTPLESADFIFVSEQGALENAIESAKCGTLSDPHKSATVIIQNDENTACRLTLSGPGINGQAEIPAAQTVKDAIDLRDARQDEYPQGIDLIFISKAGRLVAIPRLTRMEVVH
jgi:alpha-D-ribose 1-methylphosphonate 5-triphosphate synthase subunit PhnH